VAVESSGQALVPEAFRPRIIVHTVHDGDLIPDRFRRRADGSSVVLAEALEAAHIRERDWGANLVARNIAQEAGLDGYGRTRIARALLDFNRFPGTSHLGHTDPLERLAINPPFSTALTHAERMDLLSVYDAISDHYESLLANRLIIIGVHTYDEHNPSATSRPHLSIVTQPLGYHRHARMPYGLFDPIYPDVLGESTSSRILRDRMSLNLERSGFRVSNNHPYALPEGSIEVRSQVWYFFSFLRQRFLDEHPDTADDPAMSLVWRMLLNTNLREAEPEALRGFLHRYRKPSSREAALFERAQAAYDRVRQFVTPALIRDYRRSPDRPSSLALEVRKDLLCQMDERGRPMPATKPVAARAKLIGEVVAGAIKTFLEVDRNEDFEAPI
jgi:hypothetical protein